MQFDAVYSDVITRLQKELPPHLSYHNAGHTRSVVAAITQLGKMAGVSERDLLLLQTAALFHDTGFLNTYKDHEEASCNIAKAALPQYGYHENDIARICQLIMATRLAYEPKNKFEELIRDADLNYLGTDNYAAFAEELYKELKAEGLIDKHEDWCAGQIHFFNWHRYFSDAAIQEYGAKKAENKKNL